VLLIYYEVQIKKNDLIIRIKIISNSLDNRIWNLHTTKIVKQNLIVTII